jgi:pimeloyl-ACP methyl ester carboxylesterase
MIDPSGGEPRAPDRGRQIRFVVTPTGVRVAYATVGRGPALVVPAAWAAMIDLVRAHWGLGSDVLADIFLPDASAETKAGFARLQRRSASAELACELLGQVYEIRVDQLLDRVAAPTLVLHRRDDRTIPHRLGRDLAARIPGRGWCRWPAAATSPTPATPRRWSARSWGSWTPPAGGCPPSRPTGQPSGSRPASSRLPPWSPPA